MWLQGFTISWLGSPLETRLLTMLLVASPGRVTLLRLAPLHLCTCSSATKMESLLGLSTKNTSALVGVACSTDHRRASLVSSPFLRTLMASAPSCILRHEGPLPLSFSHIKGASSRRRRREGMQLPIVHV